VKRLPDSLKINNQNNWSSSCSLLALHLRHLLFPRCIQVIRLYLCCTSSTINWHFFFHLLLLLSVFSVSHWIHFHRQCLKSNSFHSLFSHENWTCPLSCEFDQSSHYSRYGSRKTDTEMLRKTVISQSNNKCTKPSWTDTHTQLDRFWLNIAYTNFQNVLHKPHTVKMRPLLVKKPEWISELRQTHLEAKSDVPYCFILLLIHKYKDTRE